MKITCLGNKGYDVNQQEGFSFLIESNSKKILLDCGVYTLQALRKIGYTPNDIDIIYISHMHPDHCLGLPWFFNSLMLDEYYKEYEVSPKKIIFPNSNDSEIVNYIKKYYGWMFQTYNIEIDTNMSITTEEFMFEIFPIHHGIPNFALSIRTNNSKVVYIPDCDLEKTKDIPAVVNNSDFAIFSIAGSVRVYDDAKIYGFSTSKEVADFSKKYNIKDIWLFHNFYQDDKEAIINEVVTAYGNSFLLPDFGDIHEL